MTETLGRFTCNLCGSITESKAGIDDHESSTCAVCGSSARFRAIALALSRALFGLDLPVTGFPVLKSVRGLGIGDSEMIAGPLARCFNYINTHYDREPTFDLMRPGECEFGRYDFVLCSDVLEHVPPPPDTAFETLSRLLKPSGFLIITVPYTLDSATVEHFPDLEPFGMAEVNGQTVLVSRSGENGYRVFDHLTFHGGPGFTLEMRVYSEADLRAKLAAAGFLEVRSQVRGSRQFGVAFAGPCSLPLLARRGPFALCSSGITELMEQWTAQRNLLDMVRESRWIKIGRGFGVGPRLTRPRL